MMAIERSRLKVALCLLCAGKLLTRIHIDTMRFLTTLVWASCALRAQVQAQEVCQVTTRLIEQIIQLSYSLTISNTSSENDGHQTQHTGSLVLASQGPSTTTSPSQATLDCATSIPGFDSFCGQRPGPESVIERTLQKRRLFSYQECADACAIDEICTGAAFHLVKKTCDLYSYISYLLVSREFETLVKISSANPVSSSATTISRGAQSLRPTSPLNTDSTGKAISTGLASYQVSSWLTESSQSLVVLTTTTQSSSVQISFGAAPSTTSSDSLSMSLLSSQDPSTSGISANSLPVAPISATLNVSPTSTKFNTQTSSSVNGLVTSSPNSLPPVSPSSIGSLPPVPTSSVGSSSYASSPSTTSSATPTVPTCYFRGFDGGLGNIGFYADAVSGTVEGCDALCDANPSCLSFAVETDSPACILYNHTINGYDLYSSDSPFNFFLRGGGCPPMPTTTSSSSTSASPLPSPIFPVVSLTCTIRLLAASTSLF